MEKIYEYRWGNNPKRATFKGRHCRLLAIGRMNSVLIQFIDNGEKTVTSKWAIKSVNEVT